MESAAGQLGLTVLAVPHPHPARASPETETLMLYDQCSATTQTLVCYNIILITDSKHSTVQATMEKINSISAKNSMISIPYSTPLQ